MLIGRSPKELEELEQCKLIVTNELPRFLKDVKSISELHPTEYNGGIKPKNKGKVGRIREMLMQKQGTVVKEEEAKEEEKKEEPPAVRQRPRSLRRPQTAVIRDDNIHVKEEFKREIENTLN